MHPRCKQNRGQMLEQKTLSKPNAPSNIAGFLLPGQSSRICRVLAL